jgi:hypothetical protein
MPPYVAEFQFRYNSCFKSDICGVAIRQRMRYFGTILLIVLAAAFASDSWGQSKRAPAKGDQQQTQTQEQKAAGDQRGTEQLPFIVQPLPTKKTAELTEKENREAKEKSDSDWWTWLLGVLTIVALFGQLVVFIAQASYLKGTLKATAAAATAAVKAAEHIPTIERAFVKLSGAAPGIKPDRSGLFWINISTKNFGRTPATISDTLLNYLVLPHGAPLPDTPSYVRQTTQIPGAFLVSDEEIFTRVVYRITLEEMGEVQDFQSDLYLIGYVDYRDQFGGRHRAGYARVYRPAIDDGATYRTDAEFEARSNLVFVASREYNYDRPRLPGDGGD